MNNLYKGAIHLHTNISHDGTMSSSQLAAFLKTRGYDFIAITEHSYDLDDRSIKMLEEDAAKLSSSDFLIIPGIEFRGEYDIDILGLGVTRPCRHMNPSDIIEHICDNGGVAIWAHPTIRQYPYRKEWVSKLHGFEIWNLANNGKYLPQLRPALFYRRLREWNPEMKAFAGLDLHRENSFYRIALLTSASSLDRNSILENLRSGEFVSDSRFCKIDSKGHSSVFYGFLGTAAKGLQTVGRKFGLFQ